MIENIRKYTGLMIVVLALLFIGLVFLGDNVSNSFASKPVMEIDGKGVSQKEFQRKAVDVLRLPYELPTHFLPKETLALASKYVGDEVMERGVAAGGQYGLLSQMAALLQGGAGRPDNFLVNRFNVQKAGLEYGATPSNDEVEFFVENVLFADPQGKYDQAAYEEFLNEKIGNMGIGNSGFNEFIRDLLTAHNLSKIIGGGIAPVREGVNADFDSGKQIIAAKQISLDTIKLETEVKPTEEEIKNFYEENKDQYNSDELRTVTYVMIEPDWKKTLDEVTAKKEAQKKKAEEERKKREEEAKKAKEAADKANTEKNAEEATKEEKAKTAATPDTPAPATSEETPVEEGSQGETGNTGEAAPEPVKPPAVETPVAPADPTPTQPAVTGNPIAIDPNSDASVTAEPVTVSENKTQVEPKKPIELKPKDQLSRAEQKEAVTALTPAVTKFFADYANDPKLDFDKIAKQAGYELKKSEPFSRSEPAKPLDAIISGSPIGNLAAAVFSLPPDGADDQKITDPLQTNEGWFIGRLDAVEESVPLTFEEAKVRVTVDLKKKMARELMIKNAEEMREKLVAAVKEGKTFEEAAETLEQKVTTLPKLAAAQGFRGYQPPNPPAFNAARYTNTGEIAPIHYTPNEDQADRALIVLVEKREIVRDEAYKTAREERFTGISSAARYIIFNNWLYERREATEVKQSIEE